MPSFSAATVKYNWHQGDYEGMNTFLVDDNWYSVICCNPSAHDAWNAFKDILYMAIDIFVPLVEHTSVKLVAYCIFARLYIFGRFKLS